MHAAAAPSGRCRHSCRCAAADRAGAVERLSAAAIRHRRLSGALVRRLSGAEPRRGLRPACSVAGAPLAFWPVLLRAIGAHGLGPRAHACARTGSGSRPLLLLGVIAALSLLTTLPWLTSILLTDIFCGLGVLALYLLLLRAETLSRGERAGLIAADRGFRRHPQRDARRAARRWSSSPRLLWLVDRKRMALASLGRGALALVLGAVLVLAADFVVAKRLAWTPGGFALSFGRMLQDGIVKKYLDQHCPDPALRLCAYKDQLARRRRRLVLGQRPVRPARPLRRPRPGNGKRSRSRASSTIPRCRPRPRSSPSPNS